MIISKNYENQEIRDSLSRGAVGIIPTDTLYGLVGSAFSRLAVEKIYALKKRDLSKPLIVLISNFEDLKKFEVDVDSTTRAILKKHWPGPTTVILHAPFLKFDYLNRGGETIAFRLPRHVLLRKFIKNTGPLVAPSANSEGMPPARTFAEAKKYFKENVDFFIDQGILEGNPSALIKIKNGKVFTLR